MKRYSVNVHYDVVIPVEVFANSEEEAIESASETAQLIDISTGDVAGEESCVTESTDVNDNLVKKEIFKELVYNRTAFSKDRKIEDDKKIVSAMNEYFEENPDCLVYDSFENIVTSIEERLD